ncbi:MAG: ABC transporter substrate-binding protein [Candidatus Aminicenantes bacterium]|nr:ABC transporter substrate-binding protein [Candidatus Aminicenantes bacterium]
MANKLGRKGTALVFFLLLLSNTNPSFAAKREHNKPKQGGVFRFIALSDVTRIELDPANPYSFIFLSEQMYDGLVRLDKNLRIEPSLAEFWEISSDGTVYTFYLRKGVRFHDGSEFTAQDVKFSLERLLDRNVNSPHYQYFVARVEGARDYHEGRARDVRGFKVLDDATFQIQWTKPFVPALYLMSMHFCKILPRKKVIEDGENFWLRPSGTGPFVFDYWMRTPRLEISGVRLKRNDAYFDGRPYLDGLEFGTHFFTPDDFFEGKVDSIPVLTSRLLRSNYQIFQDGALTHFFLGMSCHIYPLDRPSIRQALARGLDKAAITEAAADIRYLRKVTDNYIPSRLYGFYPQREQYPFDLKAAREILRQEGFSQESRFPSLTVCFELPRTPLKNKIFREIRDQLSAMDISSRQNYYESPEELMRVGGPYLVFFSRALSIPDPEDMIRPLFYSDSILNGIGYRNPELDGLIQDAEGERSLKKRVHIFQNIEKILREDVPAIPLFSHQNRMAVQPYVRGVVVPALGVYYIDATKIWLDR